MTYVDAAVEILKSSRKPMTAREITELAIRKGLIEPQGKTPIATMNARLYVYTRDAEGFSLIRRQYVPGRTRAARDSVRWLYNH